VPQTLSRLYTSGYHWRQPFNLNDMMEVKALCSLYSGGMVKTATNQNGYRSKVNV